MDKYGRYFFVLGSNPMDPIPEPEAYAVCVMLCSCNLFKFVPKYIFVDDVEKDEDVAFLLNGAFRSS